MAMHYQCSCYFSMTAEPSARICQGSSLAALRRPGTDLVKAGIMGVLRSGFRGSGNIIVPLYASSISSFARFGFLVLGYRNTIFCAIEVVAPGLLRMGKHMANFNTLQPPKPQAKVVPFLTREAQRLHSAVRRPGALGSKRRPYRIIV